MAAAHDTSQVNDRYIESRAVSDTSTRFRMLRTAHSQRGGFKESRLSVKTSVKIVPWNQNLTQVVPSVRIPPAPPVVTPCSERVFQFLCRRAKSPTFPPLGGPDLCVSRRRRRGKRRIGATSGLFSLSARFVVRDRRLHRVRRASTALAVTETFDLRQTCLSADSREPMPAFRFKRSRVQCAGRARQAASGCLG